MAQNAESSEKVVRFRKGSVLVTRGEIGRRAFRIVRGRVHIMDDPGRPGWVLGPGDTVGGFATLCGTPHEASAQALEPVVAIVVERPRIVETARRETDAVHGLLGRLIPRGQERMKKPGCPDWTLLRLKAHDPEVAANLPEGGVVIESLPFVVGRKARFHELRHNEHADFALRDAKPFNLSRRHFVIDNCLAGPVVCDLGSQLGTLVNGRRIGVNLPSNQVTLAPGRNEIICGGPQSPFRFTLHVERAGAGARNGAPARAPAATPPRWIEPARPNVMALKSG